MSIKRQREEFISYMVRALPAHSSNLVLDFCRKALRLSQTHGRLACADCNGDYPGPWIQPTDYQDPKQRERYTKRLKECARCGSHYAKETINKAGICKSCRVEDQLRALASSFGLSADFQGDPRGWTCKLIVIDSLGGRREIGNPQSDR